MKSWEIRSIEIAGDTAQVRVQTTMVAPDGEEDGEPMRFEMVRVRDRWLISRLE